MPYDKYHYSRNSGMKPVRGKKKYPDYGMNCIPCLLSIIVLFLMNI